MVPSNWTTLFQNQSKAATDENFQLGEEWHLSESEGTQAKIKSIDWLTTELSKPNLIPPFQDSEGAANGSAAANERAAETANIAFDDDFSTVENLRLGTVPTNWTELNLDQREAATDANFQLGQEWSQLYSSKNAQAANKLEWSQLQLYFDYILKQYALFLGPLVFD